MNTKAILLAAILGVGAVAALVPTAAAEDIVCHGDADLAEVCYNRHLEIPGYLVGVHTPVYSQDLYWT